MTLDWSKSALDTLLPSMELAYKVLQDVGYAIYAILELHHAPVLPVKH